MMSGRAATPRRSASPLVSSSTGTFAARAARTRPAYAPTGTAGGRLPHRATAEADASRSPYACWKADHSAGVTVGPGSLSWVVSPVRSSTTAIVRRVAPVTGIRVSTTPGMADSCSRTTWPVAPPVKPVTVTSCPRAASTRATFRPLPPGRSVTSETRWDAWGRRARTR